MVVRLGEGPFEVVKKGRKCDLSCVLRKLIECNGNGISDGWTAYIEE